MPAVHRLGFRAQRKSFGAFAAILTVSALSSCNSVQNLQSVKDKDYTAPKNVYGYLQPSTFSADKAAEDFKKYMVDGLAECGIRLQFQPGALPSVTPPAGFDSVLGFHELGHETVTQRGGYVGYDQFNDMYRVEVTLTALPARKVVWKSQGDFRTQDNRRDVLVTKAIDSSAAATWSGSLLKEMRADALLGPCLKTDAIAPGEVTSAAAVPGAQPVQPVASAAAAPAPAKPSSYKIDNVVYPTLGDAETAMRANAAKEVAQITPFPAAPRESLLIVAGTDKLNKIATTANAAQMEPILAFIHLVNQVGYDTTADAVRQSNLFKQVTLVRADDVADGDFKGAAYKLWFSSGSWGLARQGGTRQKVDAPTVAEPKFAKLNAFVTSLQQATIAADGK